MIVDMICDINPEYRQHVVYSHNNQKRQQYIYAKLKKAVYSTLIGVILFYIKLSSQLKECGFKKNPYDECTSNKFFDGEQLTIQYHVDDCICLCKHK